MQRWCHLPSFSFLGYNMLKSPQNLLAARHQGHHVLIVAAARGGEHAVHTSTSAAELPAGARAMLRDDAALPVPQGPLLQQHHGLHGEVLLHPHHHVPAGDGAGRGLRQPQAVAVPTSPTQQGSSRLNLDLDRYRCPAGVTGQQDAEPRVGILLTGLKPIKSRHPASLKTKALGLCTSSTTAPSSKTSPTLSSSRSACLEIHRDPWKSIHKTGPLGGNTCISLCFRYAFASFNPRHPWKISVSRSPSCSRNAAANLIGSPDHEHAAEELTEPSIWLQDHWLHPEIPS